MQRTTIVIIIGAIAAVLLQIIVAPNIAIFSAMPNFIIVYVLVIAMIMPGNAVYITAFALGLLADFLGYGPIGALPFILLVVTALASWAFTTFDNDTVFIPLGILMICALISELVYALFMLACGLQVDPVGALVYRALPCALYDCVVGLIVYLLMVHFFGRTDKPMGHAAPKLTFR